MTQKGILLLEGKTKQGFEALTMPTRIIFDSKDDITAGDGKKHDILPGKGALSTRTNANIMRLLKACGIPVAFVEQVGPTTFVADACEMLLLEEVMRRESHGSHQKSYPHIRKGQRFERLLSQSFLKTSGKKWKDLDLPVDDPLMRFTEDGKVELLRPDQPIEGQKPFAVLEDYPLKDRPDLRAEIEQIKRKVFLILEAALRPYGLRLVDFKIEFGITRDGRLVLADVIDSDSWRVVKDKSYMDKQIYRDGGSLDEVLAKYQKMADITDRFELPMQQLIVWAASPKDELAPFKAAFEGYGGTGACLFTTNARSLHKQPVLALEEVCRLVNDVPDTVIVVYVGLSNGAGPTISANVTVPVITVPASWKDCREDIWSSLRTPSETPVSTILEPANAVLHALQILAMRNPRIWAELRYRQEERLQNFACI